MSIDKNNLDRKPTKVEGMVGIVLASFLSLLFGAISINGWYLIYINDEFANSNYEFFIVMNIIFIISVWLWLKLVFGVRKRPTKLTVVITGYFFAISGIAFLIVGVVLDIESLADKTMILAIGLLLVSRGMTVVTKARAKK